MNSKWWFYLPLLVGTPAFEVTAIPRAPSASDQLLQLFLHFNVNSHCDVAGVYPDPLY